MSKLILYHLALSPPSRFAFITAEHLGLEIEVRHVDNTMLMSPEYKLINPTATVPALIDGDTKVFDSSAIGIYLVEKYAKDDTLYPKDLKLRTKVNERLFYISSFMFPKAYFIFVPGYGGEETEIPQEKIDGVMRGYETIETFLEGNVYLTGDTLTLADLSLWTMMESFVQIISLEKEKFPNFDRWLNKMRDHPSSAMNRKGADEHIEFYRKCIENALTEAIEK